MCSVVQKQEQPQYPIEEEVISPHKIQHIQHTHQSHNNFTSAIHGTTERNNRTYRTCSITCTRVITDITYIQKTKNNADSQDTKLPPTLRQITTVIHFA